MFNYFFKQTIIAFAALSLGGFAGLANAQAAQSQPKKTHAAVQLEEVVVTAARKKRESELDVPMAMSVLSSAEIGNFGVSSFQDIAAITPTLTLAAAPGNSGGSITLRGIGTFPSSPGVDQAVGLDIDGVTISDATALRLAQFDIKRVEILQGPQSLYYGMNTSAGLISIITNDPTPEPYAMVRVGYTEQSIGWRTEAVLSGPLTKTLGARLAFYRSDQAGYFRNPLFSTPGTPTATQLALFGGPPQASEDRTPQETRTGFRVTLMYKPNDAMSMRLKSSYVKDTGSGGWAAMQVFYCASGVPAPGDIGNVAGVGDCRLDNNAAPIGHNPTAAVGGDPLYRNGEPYQKTAQYIDSLTQTYKIAHGLTLHSITGFYKLDHIAGEIVTATPYPLIGSTVTLRRKSFSQELRLSTDLDSPLNGMAGFYFQKGRFYSTVSAYSLGNLNAFAPEYTQHSTTYSGFGRLRYDFFDKKFQISAGARYTHETKDLRLFSRLVHAFVQNLLVSDKAIMKEFLPSVTASWFPSPHTHVFITYKKGAKAGGFNMSALQFASFNGYDLRYAPERAKGFEGGVKTLLLGGRVRLDVTGYRYKYQNLQVSAYNPTIAVASVLNAASLITKGIQISAAYAPEQIPGLRLSGSLNYTHARYSKYTAPCYTGQTISEGCNIGPNGTLVANGAVSQDLAGTTPLDAPDWSGNFRASYEFPIGSSGIIMGLSSIVTYRGKYQVVFSNPPWGEQNSSVNLDAQIHLYNDNQGWEVALIGTNLTDQLRAQWGLEEAGTPGVAPGTGTPGPGYPSDLIGITNTPRLVTLEFTIKPFAFYHALSHNQ